MIEDEIDAYEVSEAMIAHGGSFVRGLGELIRLADAGNKRKLYDAFPEYVERYRALAKAGKDKT